jgi:hypothetical protein
MALLQQINQDFKDALKAKDELRVSCLRMLKTALKNLQVEKRRELSDAEIQTAISSQVRKGQEAAAEYKKGGREDLARKEEQEIEILYGYLPKQLQPEEIEAGLREIINELSAEGPKDLGKVMKTAMARMAGQAQGKEVSRIAKKLLT